MVNASEPLRALRLLLVFALGIATLAGNTFPQHDEFLMALIHGHQQKVGTLLKARPELVSHRWREVVLLETNNTGAMPLHVAACYGQKAIIDLLLAAGAEVDAEDSEGYTPLHWAAKRNNPVIAQTLLAKGAKVNARTHNGFAPLHAATLDRRLELLQLLLAHGAEVNARTKENITPLHLAAAGDQKAATAALIAKGADLHAKSEEGSTPLALALFHACQHTPELLRRLGARE